MSREVRIDGAPTVSTASHAGSVGRRALASLHEIAARAATPRGAAALISLAGASTMVAACGGEASGSASHTKTVASAVKRPHSAKTAAPEDGGKNVPTDPASMISPIVLAQAFGFSFTQPVNKLKCVTQIPTAQLPPGQYSNTICSDGKGDALNIIAYSENGYEGVNNSGSVTPGTQSWGEIASTKGAKRFVVEGLTGFRYAMLDSMATWAVKDGTTIVAATLIPKEQDGAQFVHQVLKDPTYNMDMLDALPFIAKAAA